MPSFQNLSVADKCSALGCDRCQDVSSCPMISEEHKMVIETHRQLVATDNMNNILLQDSNDWDEAQYSEDWEE